jgi:hypothetical protein
MLSPYIGLAIVIVTVILFWHLADKGDHKGKKK